MMFGYRKHEKKIMTEKKKSRPYLLRVNFQSLLHYHLVTKSGS